MKSYITTPIYYVNDIPHIGHAYTTIICDALKRWSELNGIETKLTTGSDEHGQKIEQSAKNKSVAPKIYADEISAKFKDLWDFLGISYDYFIRTTDAKHEKLVQSVFAQMLANGDIYKGQYQGHYCVSCECFFTELQVISGECCPDCGKPTSMVSEESYFFALSKYQGRLLALYENAPNMILPTHKKNEVVRFIQGGLNDLSITRTGFEWGIKIPASVEKDSKHVVYVWLDALFSYMSALGISDIGALKVGDINAIEPEMMEFWSNTTHVIGKDILRFHAIFWPAFLMSLDLPLPRHLLVHGWWTRDGVKMSKSIGNVVNPREVVERYGCEAFRYFLLREVSFGQDGDFSYKALTERINSELSNDLGNLINRLSSMCEMYFGGKISADLSEFAAEKTALDSMIKEILPLFSQANFNRFLEELWKIFVLCNGLIAKHEPWVLAKGDEISKKRCAALFLFIINAIFKAILLLYAVMPKTASAIVDSFNLSICAQNFASFVLNGQYLESANITKIEPLFPKVEYKESSADSKIESKAESKTDSKKPTESAGEISFEDFKKLDIRMGTILSVEKIEKSDKLYKLMVDIGEDSPRQVVSGIAKDFAPDELLGSQVALLANLKPAKLMGVLSYGMILASRSIETNILGLLGVNRAVKNGSPVS